MAGKDINRQCKQRVSKSHGYKFVAEKSETTAPIKRTMAEQRDSAKPETWVSCMKTSTFDQIYYFFLK